MVIRHNYSSCAFFLLLASLSFFLVSCDEDKVTCDLPQGISLIELSVKKDLIKKTALKLATEDYKEFKGGLFDNFYNSTYKKYLRNQMNKININTGEYYFKAIDILSEKSLGIDNITTNSYDKEINKCNCAAHVIYSDNKSDKITYSVTRNSEGRITGNYKYKPIVHIDEDYDNSFNKIFISQLLSDDSE
jgi:hypothetical protein